MQKKGGERQTKKKKKLHNKKPLGDLVKRTSRKAGQGTVSVQRRTNWLTTAARMLISRELKRKQTAAGPHVLNLTFMSVSRKKSVGIYEEVRKYLNP